MPFIMMFFFQIFLCNALSQFALSNWHLTRAQFFKFFSDFKISNAEGIDFRSFFSSWKSIFFLFLFWSGLSLQAKVGTVWNNLGHNRVAWTRIFPHRPPWPEKPFQCITLNGWALNCSTFVPHCSTSYELPYPLIAPKWSICLVRSWKDRSCQANSYGSAITWLLDSWSYRNS